MKQWASLILAGLSAQQVRALERARADHARGLRWCEFDSWDEIVTPGEAPPWHCWIRGVKRVGPPNYRPAEDEA